MRERRNHWIVSGILLGVILMLCTDYPIAGRWYPFKAFPIIVLAFVAWLLWVVHLGRRLSRSGRGKGARRRFYAGFSGAVAASLIAMALAAALGARIGKSLCDREVQQAVAAGLQDDCQKLLRLWAFKDDIVFDSTPEYPKLPASLRILTPVYVVNDSLADTNTVPNIGLCKNGSGGFAGGIRVFRNDHEAEQFIDHWRRNFEFGKDFGCQRIAAGVY